MMNVKVGHRYRHFKGIIMEVIALAKHSETLEEMVIYKHVDTGEVWARPMAEFCSKVDKNKYPDVEQEYRFEEINEEA